MMFHTSLVWAMVLLTSGIVDERPQLGVMTVSTARVLPPVLGGWGGVWNLGGGLGLVGLAHCWALRDHTPRPHTDACC